MDWLVGFATLALLFAAVLLIGAVVVRAGLRLRGTVPRSYDNLPRYEPPPLGLARRHPGRGSGPELVLILGWAWLCIAAIAGTGWLVGKALAGSEPTWIVRTAALTGAMSATTLVLLAVAVPRLEDETRVDALRDAAPTLLLLLPVAAGTGYLFRGNLGELIACLTALYMLVLTDRIILYVVDR